MLNVDDLDLVCMRVARDFSHIVRVFRSTFSDRQQSHGRGGVATIHVKVGRGNTCENSGSSRLSSRRMNVSAQVEATHIQSPLSGCKLIHDVIAHGLLFPLLRRADHQHEVRN